MGFTSERSLIVKYCMTKKYALGFIEADSYYFVGQQEKLDWIPDAEEVWDMEQFRTDPRSKILMVPCFNPGGGFPCQGDYSWVDLILAVTGEFIGDELSYVMSQARRALNNQNIIFISGGKVPNATNSNRIYHPLLCWVSHVYDSSNYMPPALPDHRPYLFDAMLGQSKEHRLFVFYKLIEDNLLDKSLVSLWRHYDLDKLEIDESLYRQFSNNQVCGDLVKKHGLVNFYRSPGMDLLELPDINVPKDDPINYTSCQPTERFCKSRPDVVLNMAMDIPVKIYDASWYSIVAETRWESDNLFITEKLGKPLWSKRVFINFGAKDCLAYLRSQGFQTFDGIIDESYDTEPNNRKRFEMAWEQVKLLSTLDPLDVYRRAEPALENNYRLIPTLKNEHLKIREFISQFLPDINT